MKGVILAGGRGERLKPVTNNKPKPMVTLLDKPLLQYNLELLKKQGILDVTITVCYKKEQIIEYFGDGSLLGMKITYLEESEPLGTAGSLFRCANQFKESFIVLSGDGLTNIPIEQAIHFHKAKQALMTLVAVEVENPIDFGICLTSQEGRLVSFIEKPSKSQLFSRLANTGIYIIDPELFGLYQLSGRIDFAKDLFPLLIHDQQPVFVFQSESYWQDIGNPFQYWLAERKLKEGIDGITYPTKVLGRQQSPYFPASLQINKYFG